MVVPPGGLVSTPRTRTVVSVAVQRKCYTTADIRRVLRELGKALGGSKQKDGERKGKRKQEEWPDGDGRQEP